MTTKTIAAEEYLCQLQLEILRLREVVSGLYRAGEDRQNDVFYRTSARNTWSLWRLWSRRKISKPASAHFPTYFSGNPALFCV